MLKRLIELLLWLLVCYWCLGVLRKWYSEFKSPPDPPKRPMVYQYEDVLRMNEGVYQ